MGSFGKNTSFDYPRSETSTDSGAKVIFGEVAEEGSSGVGDLELIQARIVGEEAAIVGGDFQPSIADIDGALQQCGITGEAGAGSGSSPSAPQPCF